MGSVHPCTTAVQTRVAALAAQSLAALFEGDIATAIAAADAGRALVDSRTRTQRHADVAGLAALGWAESWLERYPDAESHLRAGITAARQTGRADQLPPLLIALSHVACWTGQLPTAVRLARGARRHGDREVRGAAAALESIATLWIGGRGSRARSLDLARNAVALSGLDGWSGRVALASLGQARLFSDDAAGCRRLVLDAGRDDDLSGLPAPLRPMWYSQLCAASLRLGDVDAAAEWAGRAATLRHRVGLPGQRCFAAMATGQVLLRRGEPAAALSHLRSAAAGFRGAGMQVLHALALVAAARCAVAAGDTAIAGDLLRVARRTAMACGSQRIVELADRAASGHVGSSPPRAIESGAREPGQARPALSPAPRHLPSRSPLTRASAAQVQAPAQPAGRLDALTARERQIALIAGDGTKTGTIARRLGVSPRTVDVHLSRIYRKLGVPGRAGLVAIVARLPPALTPDHTTSDVLTGPSADTARIAHRSPENLGQQLAESWVEPFTVRPARG